MLDCPYKGCTYQTDDSDALDDHIVYMTTVVQDAEHAEENRR